MSVGRVYPQGHRQHDVPRNRQYRPRGHDCVWDKDNRFDWAQSNLAVVEFGRQQQERLRDTASHHIGISLAIGGALKGNIG